MYFYEKNWLFSHEINFSGSRMQLFKNKKHLNTREAEWIEGARRGDRRSQKAIYDLLSAKMFAVCLRYMGERDAAEDILQDGFVTLFSKLDSYSGEGSFEGWARKIFVNTALMSLRKKDALKNSEDVDAAWNITSDDPNAIQKIGYRPSAGLPDGLQHVCRRRIFAQGDRRSPRDFRDHVALPVAAGAGAVANQDQRKVLRCRINIPWISMRSCARCSQMRR